MAQISEKGVQFEFVLPFLDSKLTITAVATSKEEAVAKVKEGLQQAIADLDK